MEGRVCLSVLDRFGTEVEDWLGIKRIGGKLECLHHIMKHKQGILQRSF